MLGTNPWFMKPWAIGEKVDSFRMVLKVQSRKRSKKVFKKISNRTSSDSWSLKILIKTAKNRHLDRRVGREHALALLIISCNLKKIIISRLYIFTLKAPTLTQAVRRRYTSKNFHNRDILFYVL